MKEFDELPDGSYFDDEGMFRDPQGNLLPDGLYKISEATSYCMKEIT